MSSSTCRNACDGTAITRTSASRTASEREAVAVSLGCRRASPRYRLLRDPPTTSATTSAERAHSTVGALRARMEATVVPQEPPPRTTTRGTRAGDVSWGLHGTALMPASWVRPLRDAMQGPRGTPAPATGRTGPYL